MTTRQSKALTVTHKSGRQKSPLIRGKGRRLRYQMIAWTLPSGMAAGMPDARDCRERI